MGTETTMGLVGGAERGEGGVKAAVAVMMSAMVA